MTVSSSRRPDGTAVYSKSGRTISALRARLEAIHRAWTERHAIRRACRQLQSMSDRELKDIGLTRSAVRARILARKSGESDRPTLRPTEAPAAAEAIARRRAADAPLPEPANRNNLSRRSA